MCKLKSAVVLKDRIFCPDYDSHDAMLKELGIKDTKANAKTKFVRVELSPKDEDIFSPIETWKLRVDQDIKPDWFFEELELPKIREAIREWASKHIFINQTNLEFHEGTYYLKNSHATLHGSSQATLYDSSQATLCDSSTGVIPIYSSSSFERHTIKDHATLKDCKTKTIYQSGDWKYVPMGDFK